MTCTIEPTGIEELDRLIYAIETASEIYHNTSYWEEECEGKHYGLTGKTPIEWVNNEFNEVAKFIKKLKKE